MTVRRVFTQARVSHDDHFRRRLSHRANRTLNDSVFGVSSGRLRVFRLGQSEKDDATHARARTDKQRQHEIFRREPRFAYERTDRVSSAKSTWTMNHVRHINYQRWYAGWPGLTATKVPRQVAQTLSCAINSPSTIALTSVDSTTCATSFTGRSLGVGRKSLIEYSAVTVQGGLSAPLFCIRCHAADQLQ